MLNPLEIEAVSADDFLSSISALYPAESIARPGGMRIDYNNPPFTPTDFIFGLQAKGMPKLISLFREHIVSL